ncbi:1-deoxy-D-xylulose-5-phosphate reductoisomerase [Candidatus Omnitrophota bacterium]
MQKIAILGSTGSIGTNALDVISRFPDRFSVACLSTNSNVDLLARQAKKFKPKATCVVDAKKSKGWKYKGIEGLCRMLEDVKVDIVVVAIVGSSALLPILTALDKAKRIALANKEALVMAGSIIMKRAKNKNVKIVPVDSEHSAIFQCISSNDARHIKNICLTGSGGPLLNTSKKKFKGITPKQAVNHPKWKMGKKISVDSATMMNKGLEVIEAHHLFGLDVDRIKVLIHPETIVHSMVEFIDGSILAQMGACDMRIPIQYALTYPSRSASHVKEISFSKMGAMHFQQPDFKRFPCLEIAYRSGTRGKTYPCVLNASNEVAVGEFLKGEIAFTDIPRLIEKVLESHKAIKDPRLKDILETDAWARAKTKEVQRLVL